MILYGLTHSISKKSVIGLIPDSKPGNGFSFGLKLGPANFYFGYFRPIRSYQLLLSGTLFVPRPKFNREDYYIGDFNLASNHHIRTAVNNLKLINDGENASQTMIIGSTLIDFGVFVDHVGFDFHNSDHRLIAIVTLFKIDSIAKAKIIKRKELTFLAIKYLISNIGNKVDFKNDDISPFALDPPKIKEEDMY
jgi:hypothetical protein